MMSKYYKEEDLQKVLIGFTRGTGIDSKPYNPFDYAINVLALLPAIEDSGDAISREYMFEQLRKAEEEKGGIFETDSEKVKIVIEHAPSVIPSRAEGEWKWETNDICHNCGYEIPHLERIVGETVLMDSKDWQYCPNCGAKRKGANDE